jgi:hypothetical protein
MQKRDIKRAVQLITDEGRERDVKRLVLAVKASAKAASVFKDEAREAIAEDYGDDEADRLKRGGDMVVGFLVRAEDIANDYYVFEADLAGLLLNARGEVDGFYHTGRVVTIRPDAISLVGAMVVDDNMETHPNVMEAAITLIEGPRRGGRGSRYYWNS